MWENSNERRPGSIYADAAECKQIPNGKLLLVHARHTTRALSPGRKEVERLSVANSSWFESRHACHCRVTKQQQGNARTQISDYNKGMQDGRVDLKPPGRPTCLNHIQAFQDAAEHLSKTRDNNLVRMHVGVFRRLVELLKAILLPFHALSLFLKHHSADCQHQLNYRKTKYVRFTHAKPRCRSTPYQSHEAIVA